MLPVADVGGACHGFSRQMNLAQKGWNAMAACEGHSTFAELLTSVESLVDQIKVLVTAVDDLRYEIEWQARNQTAAREDSPWAPVHSDAREDRSSVHSSCEPDAVANDLSAELSAAARLHAYEASLAEGPRGVWLDEWSERDDFEMPIGRIISVDAQMWSDALDIRPVHVVGDGCCCEDGVGAPYLLAWEAKGEFFLRELTEDESVRLQMLCLQALDESERERENLEREKERAQAKQLGLF